MQYMYRVLSDQEIPNDAGVDDEIKIPHTSRRVDFLISGKREDKNSVELVNRKNGHLLKPLKGKKQS